MECDGQEIWVVVFSDIYFKIKEESKKWKLVLRAKVTAKRSVCTSSKIQVQTDRNQQQHSFIIFFYFLYFLQVLFFCEQKSRQSGRPHNWMYKPAAGACRRSDARFSYSE